MNLEEMTKKFPDFQFFLKEEGVEVIPTPLLSLNEALGIGGIPRGRITEIFGVESSGKTTFSLQMISQANSMGLNAIFFDAEYGFNPSYAFKLGVQRDKFFLIRGSWGEGIFSIIEEVLSSSQVGIIVIDSLAAISPEKERDASLTEDQYAVKARMLSKAFRKILTPLFLSNAALVLINQVIDNIGGIGYVTPGGRALKFYASLRLELKAEKREQEYSLIKFVVAKNKLACPFSTTTGMLVNGEGFSLIYDIVQILLKAGKISKSGSWLEYKGKKFQGISAILEELKKDSDLLERARKEAENVLGMQSFEWEGI